MTSVPPTDRHNPTHVLKSAVDQFEAGDDVQSFIPSSMFQGPRPGYYFSTGTHGTGYYLDNKTSTHTNKSMSAPPPRRPRNAQELLQEAEEAAEGMQIVTVDSKTLKKLLNTLERKYNHNIEQRAKYSNEPSKFLESEIELDEAVRSLTTIATSPELYPELAQSNAVSILVSLLNHENGDIAADTIELLSELTDADVVEDSEEHALLLIDALINNSFLPSIVQRLTTFNESITEEATAIYNALSVLENCIDLKPDIATTAALQHNGILEWLLRRLKPKADVDANKQYAAEVLAVVLQSGGTTARQRFIDLDGVDRILQAVAPYRSKDATTTEEEEFIENAFDGLCALLMEQSGKIKFLEAEGVELMVLIVKGRTTARFGAIKCLDFATTGYPAGCDRVVEAGGLGPLFSVFMGKTKKKNKNKNNGSDGGGGVATNKKVDAAMEKEEEERCVSIISNLVTNTTQQSIKERVAAKFVEKDFEKCDRLMEIYFRYEKKVLAETEKIEAEMRNGDDDDDIDDELMLTKLDAGLYTLQQCAVILGELWAIKDTGVNRRLLMLLHQRGHTLKMVRAVLMEHLSMIAVDVESDEEKREQEKKVRNLTHLLTAMGHREDDEEESDGGDGREKRIKI